MKASSLLPAISCVVLLFFQTATAQTYSIVVNGPSDICGANTTYLTITPSTFISLKWYAYPAYPAGPFYTNGSVFNSPPTGMWICEVTTATGVYVTAPVRIRTLNTYITSQAGTEACSPNVIYLQEQTSAIYAMNIYDSYQWKLNGNPIPSAYNWNYQAAVSGTYTLEATISCGTGVSNPLGVTIYNSIPSATAITAGGPTTFCSGGSVTLSVPAIASYYQWKRNGTNISGANSPSYVATLAGTYTCQLANNCNSVTTAGVSVTVNPSPTATIAASGTTVFCQGGSVLLNASTGAGYSYQWYRNSVPVSGATNATYAAQLSGIYTIAVTASGCSATSSGINVTVNALPVVSYTGLAASYICQSPPATLTPSPAGGTFSGSGITGNQFFSSAVPNGGPYTISYSYTNSSGCTGTTSQSTSVASGYNCLLPQNLTVVSSTSTTVTLHWDYSSSSTFQVRYKKPTSTTYTTKTFTASACQNTYTLTGLKKNTTYQISIRSYCTSGTASAWSNTVTTTTPALRLAEVSEAWNLFPNPASGSVSIAVPEKFQDVPVRITVVDVRGVTILEQTIQAENPIQLNLSDVPPGFYLIQLQPNGNPVQWLKLTVQ